MKINQSNQKNALIVLRSHLIEIREKALQIVRVKYQPDIENCLYKVAITEDGNIEVMLYSKENGELIDIYYNIYLSNEDIEKPIEKHIEEYQLKKFKDGVDGFKHINFS